MEVIQGIYKIKNKNTGKVYIGQSKDIYNRWKQHKSMLEKGNHHSIKLQRAYNMVDNKDVFEYTIVEVVDNESILTNREQYYINKYNSLFNGYNCVNADHSIYKAKNKKQEYYYNMFADLYIPGSVYFGEKWLDRMINKKHMHYSSMTMRHICLILTWFYNNYTIEDGYHMQVLAWKHHTYHAVIRKNDILVARYSFGRDASRNIYRPLVDMTGYYNGETDWHKYEIPLTYENCLQKWNPIDQLRYGETN